MAAVITSTSLYIGIGDHALGFVMAGNELVASSVPCPPFLNIEQQSAPQAEGPLLNEALRIVTKVRSKPSYVKALVASSPPALMTIRRIY